MPTPTTNETLKVEEGLALPGKQYFREGRDYLTLNDGRQFVYVGSRDLWVRIK